MSDTNDVNITPRIQEASRLDDALHAWRSTLPDDVVCTDPDVLDHRGRTTFGPTEHVSAVLRPITREQVQSAVRIAHEHCVPIYPISQGRNWGYGSAAPVRPGGVVLDLSRMNRILEVNEELAYAVIEPGVTQVQLFEYLQERDLPLWPDATGAGPDASIVGNYLDRGFGHTPAADHQNQFAGIEAVLANGELLATGYGALGAETLGRIARGGPGGGLDTLFIQTNLAVVTRMSVWLHPAPERCVGFALKLNDESKLRRLIDGMRQLRFEGVFNGAPHLANDYRVLGIRARFPYETADPARGLTPKQRETIRREHGVAPWTLLAGIYGSKIQVRAHLKRAKQVLGGLGRIIVASDWLLDVGERVVNTVPFLPPRLKGDVDSAREMLEMLRGNPVWSPRQGAYWRHRDKTYGPDDDPLMDRVGYRGLSPAMPFTPDVILPFNEQCEAICAEYGFEFALTITNLAARHGIGVISITYDRESEAEEQRVIACVDALATVSRELGCEPYRLPTWGMQRYGERWPETLRRVMADVKDAFDPHGVIAPGRYLPDASATAPDSVRRSA
jgi:4-cresol dehydrogenase (hydroxylating)